METEKSSVTKAKGYSAYRYAVREGIIKPGYELNILVGESSGIKMPKAKVMDQDYLSIEGEPYLANQFLTNMKWVAKNSETLRNETRKSFSEGTHSGDSEYVTRFGKWIKNGSRIELIGDLPEGYKPMIEAVSDTRVRLELVPGYKGPLPRKALGFKKDGEVLECYAKDVLLGRNWKIYQ